jgi:hypothetical protein
MSWIEKELNQQNQQINDEQMLDSLSRELWLAVISTIKTDVDRINNNYLPEIGGLPLVLESKHSDVLEHGSHLQIRKKVYPVYYVDIDFLLQKRTITIEQKRFDHLNDKHGRTTHRQYDVALDETKTAVLREKDKTITLGELSQFALAPLLRRESVVEE